MRKNFWRFLTETQDTSDPSKITEIRLSPTDAKNIKERIDHAEKETQAAIDNATVYLEQIEVLERRIENIKETESEKLMELRHKVCHQILDYQQQIADLSSELQAEKLLCESLKRITTERANAKRGVTPKKAHDGYLVMSCRQWAEYYSHELSEAEYYEMPQTFRNSHRYPCTERRTAQVWKSIIQTPYPATMSLDAIKEQIEEQDLWEKGILDDVGCPGMNTSEINGLYQTFLDDDGNEMNGLYKWNFIANYISGYWEIELYTTHELQVPESRLPDEKKRK